MKNLFFLALICSLISSVSYGQTHHVSYGHNLVNNSPADSAHSYSFQHSYIDGELFAGYDNLPEGVTVVFLEVKVSLFYNPTLSSVEYWDETDGSNPATLLIPSTSSGSGIPVNPYNSFTWDSAKIEWSIQYSDGGYQWYTDDIY